MFTYLRRHINFVYDNIVYNRYDKFSGFIWLHIDFCATNRKRLFATLCCSQAERATSDYSLDLYFAASKSNCIRPSPHLVRLCVYMCILFLFFPREFRLILMIWSTTRRLGYGIYLPYPPLYWFINSTCGVY